jgi:hypothetical protein
MPPADAAPAPRGKHALRAHAAEHARHHRADRGLDAEGLAALERAEHA